MQEKQRIDVYLFEHGLAESREKARALIMSGEVFVNDQRVDKAPIFRLRRMLRSVATPVPM